MKKYLLHFISALLLTIFTLYKLTCILTSTTTSNLLNNFNGLFLLIGMSLIISILLVCNEYLSDLIKNRL